MGWSATARACDALDCMVASLRETYGAPEVTNGWGACARGQWFYELDREHADGSITGHVLDVAGNASPRSFRIAADGTVERFPCSHPDHRARAKRFADACEADRNRRGRYLDHMSFSTAANAKAVPPVVLGQVVDLVG